MSGSALKSGELVKSASEVTEHQAIAGGSLNESDRGHTWTVRYDLSALPYG